MKITRFCYSPMGTFSKCEIGGKTFYFCEPPWKDNKPFVSCIPEGTYGFRRDTTGQSVGFELTDVPGRTEIEIHVGNTIRNTEGCLVIGKQLGFVQGHWAVQNSRAAMREFMNILSKEMPSKVEIGSIFSAKKKASKKKASSNV